MKYVKLFEDFSKPKRIVFVGDIMQHPEQLRFERSRGFTYEGVFDEVSHLFKDADMVLGNLETTIDTELDQIKDRTGKFKATTDFIKILKHVGFTHLGVVNNHMYDYEEEGLDKTIEIIESEGIKPLYGKYEDEYFDILTFTTHINGSDRLSIEEIKSGLKRSRRDKIGIAFPHWGDQYNTKPTSEQEELAEYLESLGYNLIIGSGTHVYNDTRVKADTIIAYSLGDFISDHQKENTTDVGKILTVELDRGKVISSEEYTTETLSNDGASRIVITGSKRII